MRASFGLNPDETVWISTYEDKDEIRHWDISMQTGDETAITRSFTVQELFRMLAESGDVKLIDKPIFDSQLPPI